LSHAAFWGFSFNRWANKKIKPMKKLCLFILSLLLLFAACRKENIDEIIIEELAFEADTLTEKRGKFILIAKGDTILNEAGYAFVCKGFHGDTTHFMFSNDESNAFNYHNISKPDIDISASVRWRRASEEEPVKFFVSIRGIDSNNRYIASGYISASPVNVNIIEQSENFIKMEFSGSFNTFDLGENLPFGEISGIIEVPLYQNCEIASPIYQPESNTIIRLPYNLPVRVETHHITCNNEQNQLHLISTVPTSFEQFREDPNSLLQNENDFYIYWKVKNGETPINTRDFLGKININIPSHQGIVEFVSYYGKPIGPVKDLFFNFKDNEIRVYPLALMQDPITKKILGKCSIGTDPIRINNLESCQ